MAAIHVPMTPHPAIASLRHIVPVTSPSFYSALVKMNRNGPTPDMHLPGAIPPNQHMSHPHTLYGALANPLAVHQSALIPVPHQGFSSVNY